MARDLYDDHFKAVESMPRGVVVTLRNIATQLESSWELHTNRQVCYLASGFYGPHCSLFSFSLLYSGYCLGVSKLSYTG